MILSSRQYGALYRDIDAEPLCENVSPARPARSDRGGSSSVLLHERVSNGWRLIGFSVLAALCAGVVVQQSPWHNAAIDSCAATIAWSFRSARLIPITYRSVGRLDPDRTGGSSGTGSASDLPVTIRIGGDTIGVVAAHSVGLMYPKSMIMKPYCPFCDPKSGRIANKVASLMTTAGIRHLRIVTNEIGTTRTTYVADSPAHNLTANVFGIPDMASFGAFVCEIPNLTFSWGLNYLHNTPSSAAAEAREINSLLGPAGTICKDRLTAFEIGNEPDNANYGPQGNASAEQFAEGWQEFATAIRHSIPTARFVGPSLGEPAHYPVYAPIFLARNASLLSVLSQHYYAEGSAAYANIPGITLSGPDPRVVKLGAQLRTDSHNRGDLPIEVNESSTVANGGAAGVSNSFASALWALTNAYDFSVATYGGGLLTIDYSSDGSPYYADTYTKGYSAIIDTAKYAWANPMLAGITLVNTIGPGTMKSCSASIADLRIRCYAIKSQNALRVILVNEEPNKDATVKVILSEAGMDATSVELSGPSLNETNSANLTIQGTSFSAPSPFSSRPPAKEKLVAGRSIQTQLSSHSIKVITVETAPSSN